MSDKKRRALKYVFDNGEQISKEKCPIAGATLARYLGITDDLYDLRSIDEFSIEVQVTGRVYHLSEKYLLTQDRSGFLAFCEGYKIGWEEKR